MSCPHQVSVLFFISVLCGHFPTSRLRIFTLKQLFYRQLTVKMPFLWRIYRLPLFSTKQKKKRKKNEKKWTERKKKRKEKKRNKTDDSYNFREGACVRGVGQLVLRFAVVCQSIWSDICDVWPLSGRWCVCVWRGEPSTVHCRWNCIFVLTSHIKIKDDLCSWDNGIAKWSDRNLVQAVDWKLGWFAEFW